MSELPENGVLHWLVRRTEGGVETAGLVRSELSGALVLRGPTGTHLTGHGEGWRKKWEELAGQGFRPVESARADGDLPASWRPPRLSRKEKKLLAAHAPKRPREPSSLFNRLPNGWQVRGPSAAAWARLHGEGEAAIVEELLALVCHSFLLQRSAARFLYPTDKPLAIYEANYRGDREGQPDTLEWEHFRQELESRYETKAPHTLPILTLGEIYELVRGCERAVL